MVAAAPASDYLLKRAESQGNYRVLPSPYRIVSYY